MKPQINYTPKEDKPSNKGQAESTLVYTLYRKSPLTEDNLSTKDKVAGPESVLYLRGSTVHNFLLVHVFESTLLGPNLEASPLP